MIIGLNADGNINERGNHQLQKITSCSEPWDHCQFSHSVAPGNTLWLNRSFIWKPVSCFKTGVETNTGASLNENVKASFQKPDLYMNYRNGQDREFSRLCIDWDQFNVVTLQLWNMGQRHLGCWIQWSIVCSLHLGSLEDKDQARCLRPGKRNQSDSR